MNYSTYFLHLTLLLFLAASFTACAQDKQSSADPNESTDADSLNVTMYKNPNCQCCTKWASYMEENGFSVKEIPSDTLASVKKEKGVPNKLGACHTAMIDGYVVEGHVPVEAINKLLKERSKAKGIAVPGMPAQSPGMAEEPGPVDVYLFNGQDQVAYFGKF